MHYVFFFSKIIGPVKEGNFLRYFLDLRTEKLSLFNFKVHILKMDERNILIQCTVFTS